MSFLRFSSRCLLSGYFFADGLKAAINPDPLIDEAEPYAKKFTSFVDQTLPSDIARRVPSKTSTLVRIHGIAQALGALMMATGFFRRPGAVMVAASYLPKVLMSRPSGGGDVLPFIRELALLGGTLVEAGNTQGRPDCSWKKAQKHKKQAAASKKNQPRQTEALRDILSSASS